MGIRQPVVQRREADLGAVANKKEHESEPQYGRLELLLDAVKMRP